jgi:hypothetical protein
MTEDNLPAIRNLANAICRLTECMDDGDPLALSIQQLAAEILDHAKRLQDQHLKVRSAA